MNAVLLSAENQAVEIWTKRTGGFEEKGNIFNVLKSQVLFVWGFGHYGSLTADVITSASMLELDFVPVFSIFKFDLIY